MAKKSTNTENIEEAVVPQTPAEAPVVEETVAEVKAEETVVSAKDSNIFLLYTYPSPRYS